MKLMDEMVQSSQRLLREILLKGAVKRELIETNNFIRQIGKTTALIEFAKEFGLNVVVGDKHIVRQLRDTFNYERIFAVTDNLPDGKYVVDEMVFCINKNIDIVTGFRYVEV